MCWECGRNVAIHQSDQTAQDYDYISCCSVVGFAGAGRQGWGHTRPHWPPHCTASQAMIVWHKPRTTPHRHLHHTSIGGFTGGFPYAPEFVPTDDPDCSADQTNTAVLDGMLNGTNQIIQQTSVQVYDALISTASVPSQAKSLFRRKTTLPVSLHSYRVSKRLTNS